MKNLGIMNGRLSSPINGRIQNFPKHAWREEVRNTAELGLGCIEWVYDDFHEDNPLSSAAGIKELKGLAADHAVRINSVLGDYFMVHLLFGKDTDKVKRNIDHLCGLIESARLVGATMLELPFVDSSSIVKQENWESLLPSLELPLRVADNAGLDICLETSLPPLEFKKFLEDVNHPRIKVNYDMGNSASLGFDANEEIAAYGTYIANVHIKDRVLNGTTVPLGKGDCDFARVFAALRRIPYNGDYILQAAREDLVDRAIPKPFKDTVRGYIDFVRPHITGK